MPCPRPLRKPRGGFPKVTAVLAGQEYRLLPDFRSPKALSTILTVAGVYALKDDP